MLHESEVQVAELTGALPEISDLKPSDEARGWRRQRDWTRLWRPPRRDAAPVCTCRCRSQGVLGVGGLSNSR